MYKLPYNEDLSHNGFYHEDMHSNIPEPNISIDDGLWMYLKAIGKFKLKYKPDKDLYTMEDFNFFEKIILIPTEPPISQPSIETRLLTLEDEMETNTSDINEVVIPYCLDLDHQVTQLTNALSDITTPQGVFLNLKSILGGIDMTYKVLKRQIIAQQLTLSKATEMIEDFTIGRKLTQEQAEELTVLAHSYLE